MFFWGELTLMQFTNFIFTNQIMNTFLALNILLKLQKH